VRTGSPVHKLPVETLLKVFQLVAPPRTRDGLYDLLELSQVCRFWRTALTNQPRVWSSIFATLEDRREIVEMCLERSHPVALDVTVDASERARNHLDCTCDKDKRKRLIPNERNPCGRHFVFESLATPVHSNRIHTLNIDFQLPDDLPPFRETTGLSLGSCRFFDLSFPQLTSLGWECEGVAHTNHLFSNSPLTPTVRSLTFSGSWDGFFTQVKNLTSFILKNCEEYISLETFRLFLLNNQSLESLSLDIYPFGGSTKGPPVDLLNLRSFTLLISPGDLSRVIRVPAFQRLSSLQTSYKGVGYSESIRLLATGDGITLLVTSFLRDVPEVWQDLVGYARPTIRHVRLCGYSSRHSAEGVCFPLLADTHTLEVGRGYLMHWYDDFLDDLKQLGPQLKTIRFEVWEEMDPFMEEGFEDEMYGHELLDGVEELVKYRSEDGRPFSAVERMVVSESERSNRQQGYVWRCFYDDRQLGQYLEPV